MTFLIQAMKKKRRRRETKHKLVERNRKEYKSGEIGKYGRGSHMGMEGKGKMGNRQRKS